MVAVHETDAQVEIHRSEPLIQIAELESRLARGYEMIEDHQAAGLSVKRLEEHWLTLLADYELLVDSAV